MDGIRSVAPTAALLAFAVVYFGVMNDAGLFEPFIRRIVRLVGSDPLKVVIGTAAVASIAHLDGAGASTFMVTVPAMLPIYRRLGMSPLVLTCTTALAAGTMNILPWGGPDESRRRRPAGRRLRALRAAHRADHRRDGRGVRCRVADRSRGTAPCGWCR